MTISTKKAFCIQNYIIESNDAIKNLRFFFYLVLCKKQNKKLLFFFRKNDRLLDLNDQCGDNALV